jgi:hypothetical protein
MSPGCRAPGIPLLLLYRGVLDRLGDVAEAGPRRARSGSRRASRRTPVAVAGHVRPAPSSPSVAVAATIASMVASSRCGARARSSRASSGRITSASRRKTLCGCWLWLASVYSLGKQPLHQALPRRVRRVTGRVAEAQSRIVPSRPGGCGIRSEQRAEGSRPPGPPPAPIRQTIENCLMCPL